VFEAAKTDSPTAILQDSHDSMKKTRGAAMAVAAVRARQRVLSFGGIGNIGASVVAPASSRGIASHNGTLGHQIHKIQEFASPWNADSLLVLYSDGLKSGWNLESYPGIWSKHPSVIAGILFRDFSRERDDVTVVVARNRAEVSRS
jgi:hypothetical protein